MNQFKRAQVVILPTEKDSLIFSNSLLNKLSYEELSPKHCSHYYLYIISDDEIKEDDWFYYIDNDTKSSKYIMQCNGFTDNTHIKVNSNNEFSYGDWNKDYCKKIIATTDTSLLIEEVPKSLKQYSQFKDKSLPQPSQQFIEKYIESYNKGEIITNVLIEYKWLLTSELDKNNKYIEIDRLKVNSKDNTITIKKLKESWNKEEIIELLHKYEYRDTTYVDWESEWIEENL